MKLITKLYYISIAGVFLIALMNKIIIDRSEKYLFSRIDDLPNKKTALVLGTIKSGRNGGINPYFQYRMEAAAALYHEGKIEDILVSGDNHIIGYDEPTDMADYLVSLGVPRNKIKLDYAGFRTYDSVVRAKKVFNC